MRVLVVGSGGREHALCRALARSPQASLLLAAPGNAGIEADGVRLLPVAATDGEGIVAAARAEAVDLVVVGPEAPLVAGLVDRLEAAGIAAFGPSAEAARLEGSKGFMKDFCARHGIATAPYGRFDSADAARDFVRREGAPIVVKADGLAAGKGVTVAATVEEALLAIDAAMVDRRFAEAGAELVIERFLVGREASLFALCDGRSAYLLGTAEDHKQVGDGDRGPNTGGMGAVSPAPRLGPALAEAVMDAMVRPTVVGMAAEGRPFRGILFAGLMLTEAGPVLLEYNVRFGDPEAEALLPRLDGDLLAAFRAARDGRLDRAALVERDVASAAVVLAAAGYPGEPRRGGEIKGVAAAEATGAAVYHAATRRDAAGRLLADGGRVLVVAATGADAGEARRRAYAAVERIDWPDGFCRRDIGARV